MQNRLHLSDCPPDDIGFPYLLAEEVPEKTLRELREISYRDDPDEWHPDRKLTYQAWTSIELALSPTVDKKEANELFFAAQESLDTAYEHEDTSIKPEIIYPGSWRERRNRDALQPSNHDMYVVSGSDKIAIRSRNWRKKEGCDYDKTLSF